MPPLNRTGFAWPDGLFAVGFTVLGGSLAWALVHEIGSVFFYQMFTPESLMWACGHGFRNPLTLSPEMLRFLLTRNLAAFDCASIPPDLTTGAPGIFFKIQVYMSLTAAGLWRLLGPTQMAMAPLAVVFAAAYAAGGFVLTRAFLPRLLAIAAASVLTLSPVALTQIISLRDYSKGPFIVWAIALLILAARIAATRRGLLLVVLAGMIAGVGYGFRADLAIMVPLGAGYLGVAPRARLWRRGTLVGAYVGSFLVLASPILLLGNESTVGLFIIQGVTEPFRAFLALRPAPYALGNAYSDELTLSGVAAAERPRQPGWDAAEPGPIYGMSQSITRSTANVATWAPHFPADFMAQMLKGAGWILGYPALVAVSRGNPDPGSPLRLDAPVLRWQEPAYALFGKPWMPLVGAAGLLALLLRTAARSGREALGLAGLLLALLFYPAIQFSVRHIFQLEFIWVTCVLSLPCAAWEWRALRPALPRFVIITVAALGGLATSYVGLARFQQARLTADLSALLALPREPVPYTRNPQPNGDIMLTVPIPPRDAAVVFGTPDSLTRRVPEGGGEYDVRAAGDRMLLTIDCPNRLQPPVRLGIVYSHRPNVWQPLDTSLTTRPGATAIFPAFYRATQNFDGILVPASHAACSVGLFHLPLSYPLPLVLTAVLPDDWRSLPLRKGLGRFAVTPPQ
jgi:hypothetical protein